MFFYLILRMTHPWLMVNNNNVEVDHPTEAKAVLNKAVSAIEHSYNNVYK